jgi:hypothetical protein
MALTRRQFNRAALMGGATIASSSYNLFFPRPAAAYQVEFQLANLSTQKFLAQLKTYASAQERVGALRDILRGKNGVINIPDNVADIIWDAEAILQDRQFTQSGTELSEINSSSTLSRLWSKQKLEAVGVNVGSCFVQSFEGDFTAAKLAGPFVTAIHQALPILAKEDKLIPDEIASFLLPVRSLVDQDDLVDWFGQDGTAKTAWETAEGKVQCEYKLKKPGPGGFGEVTITMEGERLPARNIAITVNFPTKRQQAMLYGAENLVC